MKFIEILHAYGIYLGLFKTPVDVLHKLFLHGRITHEKFFKTLRPKQIDEFILYHKKAKQELEKSMEMGLVDNESSEVVAKLIKEFPMAEYLMEDNGILLTPAKRRRAYFALNQLDNLIENETLEMRVRGKRKQNYIGSSN